MYIQDEERTLDQNVNSRYTSPLYLSLFISVNHSRAMLSISLKTNIDHKRTVCLSFGQNFSQIHLCFSNQIWLPHIFCITRQTHRPPTLDLDWSSLLLLRWWWRWCPILREWSLLYRVVFVKCESYLLIPLRMLASPLDRLRPPLVTVER